MVSTDIWHIEHREELLVLYGKVSVRWAAVDLMLVEILTIALANPASAYDLIFNTVGAGKNRLDTFNRSIGQSRFDQDERIRLLSVTRSIANLIATRNDIVHSPLVIDLSIKGRKIIPTLNKVGKRGNRQSVSLPKIEAHVDAIGQLLSELEELIEELDMKYDPQALN